MRPYLIAVAFFIALISCHDSDRNSHGDLPAVPGSFLFTLLDSGATGIDFVNKVEDGEQFNILTYRNFYNGGGVAIGDINNDSLPDIYFTANQKSNKLYLNRGNFVFDDITEKAGVEGTKAWCTGVTMADVNSDGLLDIYVCNAGDVDGAQRGNELFINNGDLTFSEKAREYNLDNRGYTTHAAFFDYDLDGDLDCYILNTSFKNPDKIELYRKLREELSESGDKLMRNDGGIFTDVTREAGIYSSRIGFGLGVAVSDLNNDHLPDVYVSNDFWERDYLYINKGKGKFSEELIDRINYCSTSSMGADVADLNNDGSAEIFTTDMLPADNERLKTTIAFDPYHLEDLKYRSNYHYQITQNCLHLNDGNANFQEIAFLSGVGATDWSWAALILDFENDGNKDILVTNGILKDIMSMDFLEFIADQKRKKVTENNGIDYKNFISFIPSRPLKKYAFKNIGQLNFKESAEALGIFHTSFSNGSAYGDLDNDGDLDLVINNINSPAFVYRNETDKKELNHFLKLKFKGDVKNLFGVGAQVDIKTKSGIQTLQNFNTRGFQSSIEPNLLFGLGKDELIDELKVTWPDQKIQLLTNITADQTLALRYADAHVDQKASEKISDPEFEEVSKQVIRGNTVHKENVYNDFNYEILLPRMLSTEGPRLLTGDINNDHLEDFILLCAAGDADKAFLQNRDGTFSSKPSQALSVDADFESTCGALFDHDGDGDLDLMIGSGGNEIQRERKFFTVRFYKNDGHGNFSKDLSGAPQVLGNFSTLQPTDIDSDGDIDVFLGARALPGNYGVPPKSCLLLNIDGAWVDAAQPSLGYVGMVTDACWADVDADRDQDLIVVGDWMAIHIFKNENGMLEKATVIPNSSGWWSRIAPADLDGDGDTDFVLGNWGRNTKFKASPDKPLTLFVNDFDDNGKSEFILNWYPPGDSIAYPFTTKPELTFQLPSLRKSILKNAAYATKTYDSLFSPEVRKRSISYEASYLESAILWNDENEFRLAALPHEAQVSPVFGIVADDMDGDGNMDIWLGGNFYALKPQVGRQNANRGIYLKGNGDRSFHFQSQQSGGFHINGEVRDAALMSSAKNKRIFVARNNMSVLVFQRRKK